MKTTVLPSSGGCNHKLKSYPQAARRVLNPRRAVLSGDLFGRNAAMTLSYVESAVTAVNRTHAVSRETSQPPCFCQRELRDSRT